MFVDQSLKLNLSFVGAKCRKYTAPTELVSHLNTPATNIALLAELRLAPCASRKRQSRRDGMFVDRSLKLDLSSVGARCRKYAAPTELVSHLNTPATNIALLTELISHFVTKFLGCNEVQTQTIKCNLGQAGASPE